jgi:hypothetical protein
MDEDRGGGDVYQCIHFNIILIFEPVELLICFKNKLKVIK